MPQLDNLGLKENPFTKNNDYRYFYADQNRAQILESTEHLIEFSENLQVIIGAPGLGKTHLISALAHRMDNNWRIARISINEQVDTLSLINEILQAFGAQVEDGEELLETLENQLSEILQLGFKPVLLLDDAQYLSLDSIRFLLQLSRQKQDDEPYIKIVMCSTLEITEHLQSAELREFRDSIHISNLHNLDKEGVAGYLRHKLAIVGFDRESPFTPRIIDSIYNDSQGIPEQINFYANKFLASSGKAEEYIQSDESAEMQAPSESVFEEPDFEEDRIDRAEEQISRLAEKFDEIEQMADQPMDNMDEELFNEQSEAELNPDIYNKHQDSSSEFDDSEPVSGSSMSRFIIPVSVMVLILVAILLINTVFDSSSESKRTEGQAKEDVQLLPLELPAQDTTIGTNQSRQQNVSPSKATKAATPDVLTATESAVANAQVKPVTPLIIENNVEAKVAAGDEQAAQHPVNIIAKSPVDKPVKAESAQADPTQKPELKAIEPEPVIGSNNRQTITITGKQFDKDTQLKVSWGDNSKVFSASQTSGQFHYINSKKIKLDLTTGIETRVWQVVAANSSGQRSRPLSFDVVKPFIAKMAITQITPNPVLGSNKRQVIHIKGQGFSGQSVIELKWDKNNKHFSSRLSPDQFEYINANEIRLHISTGNQECKWRVVAKDPQSGASSASWFEVKNTTPPKAITGSIKSERWIKQQGDEHYTIQLFGSFEQQAITRFIKQYALKGDMAQFSSRRNGKNWFSLIYGNYSSREDAAKALAELDPELQKSQPWIRNFGSIKQQLVSEKTSTTNSSVKTKPISGTTTAKKATSSLNKTAAKTRDEAWIWTQSPSDYTLQLLALSTESSIQAYIKKHQLGNQAVYFKFIKNGKPLYVLIYGSYTDKATAAKALQSLKNKVPGSKPWLRRFADIHAMIPVR